MYDFTYRHPESLEEALSMLREAEDPKVLAGGQTLIPTMKQRLATPSDLIDVAELPELQGITSDDGMLVIGAAEKHAAVAASETVAAAIPALAYLAGLIGDPLVRHMGTLGGSLANNDPAADYPAAVLGLDAVVHTNQRRIPADAFFTGMFDTALQEHEIITKVAFPIPERAGYAKFPNPASRYATVGVFVSKDPQGVRVAVTGAGAVVFRAATIETALASDFSAAAVPDDCVAPDELTSDMHASAEYRAALIPVMAGRAVQAALQNA